MFNYAQVRLSRSETTVTTADFPVWEVPILRAVHGAEVVEVIGSKAVRRDLPEAADEYARLESKYKANTESGQSYIGMVYGVGERGVKNLSREIEKCRTGGAPVAEPPSAAVGEAPIDDPVAGLFDDAEDFGEGAVEISE